MIYFKTWLLYFKRMYLILHLFLFSSWKTALTAFMTHSFPNIFILKDIHSVWFASPSPFFKKKLRIILHYFFSDSFVSILFLTEIFLAVIFYLLFLYKDEINLYFSCSSPSIIFIPVESQVLTMTWVNTFTLGWASFSPFSTNLQFLFVCFLT